MSYGLIVARGLVSTFNFHHLSALGFAALWLAYRLPLGGRPLGLKPLEASGYPSHKGEWMFRKQYFFTFSSAALLVALFFIPVLGQSGDVPKLEVGAQFSLTRLLDAETPIFPPADGPVTGYRRIYRTNVGVGGRMGYNVIKQVALEGELNYFPQDFNRLVRDGVQGLFGAKAGWRGEKVSVFGKARPGFFRYEEPIVCLTTPCNNPTFTKFALDLGGVLEVYPSRRLVTRFDLSDVLIRQQRITSFRGTGEDVFRHNLQFSAGVGFRF
jgi:hypothetical protein